jgi:PKD repeat protein
MLRKFIYLAIVTLFSATGTAQNNTHLNCGTDEMHQHLFQHYPQYNGAIQTAYQKLQSFTQNYIQQSHPQRNAPYIIPVVFHVIHNYGVENISDAQIHDAIEQVNIQLRKLNSDTTDIVPAFQSIAADTEIEIRLAQIDPSGNCTSGITRTVSPLTYIGDHSVKSLIQWPPDQYLNIYVCWDAAGLAGHALLPSAADTIAQWDGIVMKHNYVGTIGTSDYFRRTVVTHEIGHYLNLQHIWGGNNIPNYFYLPVADAGNCVHDDDVADTPETIGWQSCNLSGQSCGTLDNVQNYMDYAYCARMFTEGQKLRMHATLNSPIANRNNLWQAANLTTTGTDGNVYLCEAKFTSNKTVVCQGQSVNFSDLTYHGATSWFWEISGPGNMTSANQNPSFTFNTLGKYNVTLYASNGTDTVSTTLTDYITVIPNTGGTTVSPIVEGFENQQSFDDLWLLESPNDGHQWDFYNGGYSSPTGFYIDNFNISAGRKYSIVSKPINLSGIPNIVVDFNYAFARKQSNDDDKLRILVSTNCGDTWTQRKMLRGLTTLPTVNDEPNVPFFPTGDSDWGYDIVTTITSSFITGNFRLKFEFESAGGNNIFLDNIRIYDPATTAIYTFERDDLVVYPNPANETLTIENFDGTQDLLIYDAQGKMVFSRPITGTTSIDISSFAKGMYFIKIGNNRKTVVFQ